MSKKLERKFLSLFKKHHYIRFTNEFENSSKLSRQKRVGIRKVPVKYILEHSIFNLKKRSFYRFTADLPRFLEFLNTEKEDVVLIKTTGKREYRVANGNNRVFFTKHFSELIGRKWIWAEVFEMDLSKGIKSNLKL